MNERAKPNAPLYIKVFVAVHLSAITIWSLPNAPTGIRNGRIPAEGQYALLLANEQYGKRNPFVRTYLQTTGFWQYWDMFAPDPASQDKWGDAEIIRQNGTVERYQYPRMYLLPLHKKLVMERYRKFFERVSVDQYAYLWPQFALVIASKLDNQPNNRPKTVKLYRYWQDIPPVGQPMPKEYKSAMFWQEDIDPKRLDGLKKAGR